MKETKDLFVDSAETFIKVRIFNPIRMDVETVGFTLGWVVGEHILSKSTGWRLKAGRISPPSRQTPKGYVPTSTLSERLSRILGLMLQEWREEFRGVEFPESKHEGEESNK